MATNSALYLRLSKAALVAMVSLFALLVTWNNIVDYDSNFQFVVHVLSMDTIFENSVLADRSIHSTFLHHAFYWLIIAAEGVVGAFCAFGAFTMITSAKQSSSNFFKAKFAATIGLVLGISLWFTGFLTIGGEWFVMWQSPTWNGQDNAFKFITILSVVLIFLHQPEPQE